jgi:hypothetical protein
MYVDSKWYYRSLSLEGHVQGFEEDNLDQEVIKIIFTSFKCYVIFLGEMENDMGALGMLNISFLDQWTSFQSKNESYNSRLWC